MAAAAAATAAASLLSPAEKRFFDLHGWLHVPAVFNAAECSLMRDLCQQWLSPCAAPPPPLEQYRGPLFFSTGGRDPGQEVITGVYNVQYGHPLFERCCADPAILRVVAGLQEGDPCLVNWYVAMADTHAACAAQSVPSACHLA